MNNTVDVYVRLEEDAVIPQYASPHAAGCDLFATCDLDIRPGETKIMPLNFVMAIRPEMEAQIRPRSGLSLKTDLRVPNSPGTIDSDYRHIVGVILTNTYNIANLPYQIAMDPGILERLEREYEEICLKDYLDPDKYAAGSEKFSSSLLNEKIFIDHKGNPYGTIYIRKGERIAQMIFCEYKRASFILHERPEDIGEDRGGGFGHTG